MPLPPCMSRAARAMSSALPQLLRFRIETISGVSRPTSLSRPRRRQACRPSANTFERAEEEAGVRAERVLGLLIDEFLRDQLVGGERPPELAAFEGLIAR